MTDNPRIADLRRRVQKDPASIAFAQLAEEHRRAGDCEEAIRVCEAGLVHHPAYLSARVTLGRALFELGRLEDARAEFLRVLEAAPENLIAIGKLAEINQRTRQISHLRGGDDSSTRSIDRPYQPVRHWETDERVLAELEVFLQAILSSRR